MGDIGAQAIANALKVRVETKSISMLSMKQNHTENKLTNISKIEESLKMKKALLSLDFSCKLIYLYY